MTIPLPQLLDRCLDEVRSGRATPEQCLAAHPEHAHEIEPLLRLALMLRPAAVPEPDAGARRRIGARVQAAMAPARPRRPWWGALVPQGARRLAAGAAVALVLLSIISTGGLVAASGQAAPGDALYPLKQRVEPLATIARREDELARRERRATRRLAELETLVRRDDQPRIARATERYTREYNRLLAAAAGAPTDRAQQALRLAYAQFIRLAALRGHPSVAGRLDASVTALAQTLGVAAATRGSVAAPAADAVTNAAAGEQSRRANAVVAQRATVIAEVLRDLSDVLDLAESRGVLTREQARELRALVLGSEALGLGGDNAVVTASVTRLSQAIGECASRGCTSQDAVDTMYAGVVAGARAVGLAEPSRPVVRRMEAPAVTPAGVATVDAGAPAPPATGQRAPAGTGNGAPVVRSTAPAAEGSRPAPTPAPGGATAAAIPSPNPTPRENPAAASAVAPTAGAAAAVAPPPPSTSIAPPAAVTASVATVPVGGPTVNPSPARPTAEAPVATARTILPPAPNAIATASGTPRQGPAAAASTTAPATAPRPPTPAAGAPMAGSAAGAAPVSAAPSVGSFAAPGFTPTVPPTATPTATPTPAPSQSEGLGALPAAAPAPR